MNAPFPIHPVLTALTIAYSNDALGFIADKALPRMPVGSSRYSWMYHPVEQAFTFPDTLVGRLGRVNRVSLSGKEQTSTTHDHALEIGIPAADIAEAKAMRDRGLGTYDPVTTAVETLTSLILTDREVRVAAKIQSPDSYAPARRLALNGTDRFSDYEKSKPISILKEGFNSTLIFRPNTMVISREGWSVLSSHPEVVNAVKGQTTSRGIVSQEDFVRLFSGEGLKELLIGESFVNTARPGQTPQISRAWGKSISLFYKNSQARPEAGATFGMTAQYGTRLAGSWEDKDVGMRGGQITRVGESVDEVITAPDVGYLIQNAF